MLKSVLPKIKYLCYTFVALVIIMVALQVLFMMVEPAYKPVNWGDVIQVVYHGLPMNLTVAGYLTVIPWLISIISIWLPMKWFDAVGRGYLVLLSLVLALVYLLDAALYPYWGFRIDMTPIFYFTTSPSAAFASVTGGMKFIGIILLAILAIIIYKILAKSWKKNSPFDAISAPKKELNKAKIYATAALAFCGVLLFLAIRGGVTVATMNPGRSYFSEDLKLNHAALNPAFNLLYSATHQDKFNKQFRFMDAKAADSVMQSLKEESPKLNASLSSKPDVYIIILESFSSHLLPSLGGENIAPNLDRIARNGITFTNAYASSFRTDRSLTAILSGYPAPPTATILKFPEKLDNLESIPRSMRDAGYKTAYYYGGDINFTNVNAWLKASGVDEIISDSSFPVSQRLSKWGVHDGPVYDRVLSDIADRKRRGDSSTPRLTIIQTSSSHEPFEVPDGDYETDDNKRIKAFRYADAMLNDFITELKHNGEWNKSLIVITPDHYGVWPEDLNIAEQRHRIPIIFTGGATSRIHYDRSVLSRPMSQTDLPATLLSLLGIEYVNFPFSNDAFSRNRKPYAFFTEPSWAAMVEPDGVTVMSTDSAEPLLSLGSDSDTTRINIIKAYLQTLYDDLQER